MGITHILEGTATAGRAAVGHVTDSSPLWLEDSRLSDLATHRLADAAGRKRHGMRVLELLVEHQHLEPGVTAHDVLTHGTASGPLGSIIGGRNGWLDLVEVRYGKSRVGALVKTSEQGGDYELYGYELSRAIAVDERFAATVGRSEPEGGALIELVPGQTANRLITGTDNWRGLEEMVTAAAVTADPHLPVLDALHGAARVRDEMVAVDVLGANSDRHGDNILFDQASLRLTLPDFGRSNHLPKVRRGLRRSGAGNDLRQLPAEPYLHSQFVAGAPGTDLRRGVYEITVSDHIGGLLEHADRDRILAAGTRLHNAVGMAWNAGFDAQPVSADVGHEVLARLDDALRTGRFRARRLD